MKPMTPAEAKKNMKRASELDAMDPKPAKKMKCGGKVKAYKCGGKAKK